MAIDISSVPAPPPAPAISIASQSAEFDERWAAWQAKGAAHDRAVRRKMMVGVPVLLAIVAVVIYMLSGA